MSDILRDLRAHKTMSQFLSKDDMIASLNADRAAAADEIEHLETRLAGAVRCDERRREEIERLEAENTRLRDMKRHCECSSEDQCMFARERDDARRESKRLRDIVSDVYVRFSSDGCLHMYLENSTDKTWLSKARKALAEPSPIRDTGGEDK